MDDDNNTIDTNEFVDYFVDSSDEVDENNQDNNLDPLELMTYEQVKLFLTDSKNFFTSTLIRSIASLALSASSMKTRQIQQVVSDTILMFSRVCNIIKDNEKQYGELTDRSLIDDIIIDSLDRVSNNIMSNSMTYSPYDVRNIFDEVVDLPKYFGDIHSDKTISEEYNKLVTENIEVTLEYAIKLQNDIFSKSKILNIIKALQLYPKFISKDANKFANINEFIKAFSNIINETSTSLSEALIDDDNGLVLGDVLGSKFYKNVIRSQEEHIRCGISIYDSITNGGFEKDRVYLLSAKTGGGKSTALLNILYGMYKNGNGLFLPDVRIINKLCQDNSNIESFRRYQLNNVNNVKQKIKKYNLNIADDDLNKKHILLYATFENTEYETTKRLISRMSLITNIFWMLIEKDKVLNELVKEKGLHFTVDDLPKNMSTKLKERLVALTSYIDIMNETGRMEIKVWWQPAYTVSAFDVLNEIKKLERKNYIVDAVFIDYPDKMKPIESTISKGDQSWDTLGKIIDNLKSLAKQASVTVLAVSQLTKQGNKDSGNKSIIIKGGSTAGSQQKENNTDTLINMNIHSKDDNELNNRVEIYKNYQKSINQIKMNMANDIFNSKKKTDEELQKISEEAERTDDILRLAQSMPDVQTINNYIVKNRDGISDISFESYIVYGIYVITDYSEEALECAKFAVETYSLIVDYMEKNKMVSNEAMQVSNGMLSWFENKMTDLRLEIAANERSANGTSLNQMRVNNNGNNNQSGSIGANGGFQSGQISSKKLDIPTR